MINYICSKIKIVILLLSFAILLCGCSSDEQNVKPMITESIEKRPSLVNGDFEDYRSYETDTNPVKESHETDFDTYYQSYVNGNDVYIDVYFDGFYYMPFVFTDNGHIENWRLRNDNEKSYNIDDKTYYLNRENFLTNLMMKDANGHESVLVSKEYIYNFFLTEDAIVTCESRKNSSGKYEFYLMAFNPEATMEKILYHGDRIRYYDIRNGEFYYIDESNDQYTYHKINVTTGVDQLVALQGCPFNVQYGDWSYFSSIGHDTGLIAVNNNGELIAKLIKNNLSEMMVDRNYIYGINLESYSPDNKGALIRFDKKTGETTVLVDEATNLLASNENEVVYSKVILESNNNDYYEYSYYVYVYSFADGTSRLLFETRIEYELSRI